MNTINAHYRPAPQLGNTGPACRAPPPVPNARPQRGPGAVACPDCRRRRISRHITCQCGEARALDCGALPRELGFMARDSAVQRHNASPLPFPTSLARSHSSETPILGQASFGRLSTLPTGLEARSRAMWRQGPRRSPGPAGAGGGEAGPTLRQYPNPWSGGQSHWHEPCTGGSSRVEGLRGGGPVSGRAPVALMEATLGLVEAGCAVALALVLTVTLSATIPSLPPWRRHSSSSIARSLPGLSFPWRQPQSPH